VSGGRGALLVPVPEAEPVVRELRERYDPSAPEGMPAGIAVLDDLAIPEDRAEFAARFASAPAFPFRLARAAAIDGAVVLVPDPVEPFRDLVRRATGREPERDPYLAVAFSDRPPVLQALAMAVRQGLPVEAVATEIRLMRADAVSGWLPADAFPLATASE